MNSPEISISTANNGEVDLAAPALLRLMAEGYGFTGDNAYLEYQTGIEYNEPLTKIFFANTGADLIGSLTVSDMQLGSEHPRAQNFWANVSESTRRGLLGYSSNMVGVHGVVVLPEWRTKKITRTLYNAMVEKLRPAVVVGSTKTPAAVLSRSRVLGDLGYRTFYGYSEVTPGSETKQPNDHLPILLAYWAGRDQEEIETGITFKGTDILLPYVPDVSSLPALVAEAFRPIIEAQLAVGDAKTAVSCLLSIHTQVLDALAAAD